MSKKVSNVFVIAGVALALVLSFIGFIVLQEDEKSSRISVAIVNEDEPTSYNGANVDFGQSLVESLVLDTKYSWTITSRFIAEDGIENNVFDAIIFLPNNFSSNSVNIDALSPDKSIIDYKVNTSSEYFETHSANDFILSFENKINGALSSTYYETVFQTLESTKKKITSIIDEQTTITSSLNTTIVPTMQEVNKNMNEVSGNFESTLKNTSVFTERVSEEKRNHSDYTKKAEEKLASSTEFTTSYDEHLKNYKEKLNQKKTTDDSSAVAYKKLVDTYTAVAGNDGLIKLNKSIYRRNSNGDLVTVSSQFEEIKTILDSNTEYSTKVSDMITSYIGETPENESLARRLRNLSTMKLKTSKDIETYIKEVEGSELFTTINEIDFTAVDVKEAIRIAKNEALKTGCALLPKNYLLTDDMSADFKALLLEYTQLCGGIAYPADDTVYEYLVTVDFIDPVELDTFKIALKELDGSPIGTHLYNLELISTTAPEPVKPPEPCTPGDPGCEPEVPTPCTPGDPGCEPEVPTPCTPGDPGCEPEVPTPCTPGDAGCEPEVPTPCTPGDAGCEPEVPTPCTPGDAGCEPEVPTPCTPGDAGCEPEVPTPCIPGDPGCEPEVEMVIKQTYKLSFKTTARKLRTGVLVEFSDKSSKEVVDTVSTLTMYPTMDAIRNHINAEVTTTVLSVKDTVYEGMLVDLTEDGIKDDIVAHIHQNVVKANRDRLVRLEALKTDLDAISALFQVKMDLANKMDESYLSMTDSLANYSLSVVDLIDSYDQAKELDKILNEGLSEVQKEIDGIYSGSVKNKEADDKLMKDSLILLEKVTTIEKGSEEMVQNQEKIVDGSTKFKETTATQVKDLDQYGSSIADFTGINQNYREELKNIFGYSVLEGKVNEDLIDFLSAPVSTRNQSSTEIDMDSYYPFFVVIISYVIAVLMGHILEGRSKKEDKKYTVILSTIISMMTGLVIALVSGIAHNMEITQLILWCSEIVLIVAITTWISYLLLKKLKSFGLLVVFLMLGLYVFFSSNNIGNIASTSLTDFMRSISILNVFEVPIRSLMLDIDFNHIAFIAILLIILVASQAIYIFVKPKESLEDASETLFE